MDNREQQQLQHQQHQQHQQQPQQQGQREHHDQGQIDENGRCTLHPGIQLHLLKRNGERRVLLTACPLCVSGLPATGQPVRIRRVASSSSSIMSSSTSEREEWPPQWGAEEAEVVAFGGVGGDNRKGGRESKEKKREKHHPSYRKSSRRPDVEEDNGSHLSGGTSEGQSPLVPRDLTGEDDYDEGRTTPGRKRPGITQPSRQQYDQSMPTTPSRLMARPRTPSPQTPLLQQMKLLQVGGQNVSDNGGQHYNQDQVNPQRVMNNRQINQHDIQHSSMGGSVSHIRSDDDSAAGTEDSPSSHGNVTDMEECVNEAHSDQSRYSNDQVQRPLPFPYDKRRVKNARQGDPRDDSFSPSGQSQPRGPIHNPHIPIPSRKPQHVQHLSSISPATARVVDREGGKMTGRPPTGDKAPKRPDPEDTDEFNEMYLGGGGGSGHLHQPHARYPSPIHSGPPLTLSSHHSDGGEYTSHQLREQSRFVSDDVSVMSMSSVTRNMHNIQRRQHEEQRQQQWHQQNYLASDVSHDRSYSEFTTKSSNSVQKPQPPMSLSSSASSGAEGEKSITVNKTKDDPGNIINTFDCDERGWCRRHPTTVRLRKKKMMRGGWQVLLSQCPECCLDEIRRIHLLGSKKAKSSSRPWKSKSSASGDGGSTSGVSGVSSGSKSSSHKKMEEKEKKKKIKNPPISQLSLHSRSVGNDGLEGSENCDDARSVGTGSTITMSTYTHSSVGGRWQNHLHDDGGDGSINRCVGVIAVVTRMPYTDIRGEYGWYTGQVDSSTGAPHGIGTMNYANGFVICEGGWHNGVNIPGDNRDKEETMPVGGTISRRQHQVAPRTTPQQGMRKHLATLNEHEKTVDYKYANSSSSEDDSSGSRSPSPDLPQQQQERTVVCGMPWTDLNGDDGMYTGEINQLKNPDGMGSMRYDYGMVVEGVWRDGEFIYNQEDDNNSGSDDDYEISHEKSLTSFYSSR